MQGRRSGFVEIVLKTIVVHSLTYFVVGAIAFGVFDYAALYVGPGLGGFLRPTTDVLVTAGPLFQPIRGLLLGGVLYLLREILFEKERGWLVLWATLIVVGVLSPYVAAPGSLEGLIYTTVPLAFHLKSLPEVVIQTLLFSLAIVYWVKNPGKRWLSWTLVIAFILVMVFPALGLLVAR